VMSGRVQDRGQSSCGACCVAVLLAVLLPGTGTQSQPAHTLQDTAKQLPEFEVAAIKLNKSGSGSSHSDFDHGRFSATNEGIKGLIQYDAYDVAGPQIEGGPSWLALERFDIEAKVDDATALLMEKLGSEDRVKLKRQLIGQLLAERFKLTVHWQTKELPVYALVQAKGGSKLTPSTDTSGSSGTSSSRGSLKASGVTMARLAETLTSILDREAGRIVVDRTGINGRYDLALEWSPEDGSSNSAANGGQNSGPSIFTALQEQLGLKLEASRGPVKTLVIDHVEQPSEN
jgi:uncharacterized protein (TIGR03435 family)